MVDATTAVREARAHTQLLLGSIGIKRIVVVDDEYAAVTVEDVIGLCGDLDAGSASGLPHLQGVAFGGDEDIWGAQLRAAWEGLNARQRSELATEARKLQVEGRGGGGDVEAERGAAGAPAGLALAEPTRVDQLADGAAEGQADAVAGTAVGGDERQVDPREDRRAAGTLEELLGELTLVLHELTPLL